MQFNRQTYTLTGTEALSWTFLILGGIGAALSLLGYFLQPERFFQSYLIAFAFWLSLSLGALFFVLLQHLTGAQWSVVLRRIPEALAASIPLLALFFLPILFGIKTLFPWTHSAAVTPDEILQHKSPYLNVTFFIVRAVIFFLVWFWLSRSLWKTSLHQDQYSDSSLIQRFRRLSAPGMILFAFTVTFASFDWLMSLDPHWQSTIFGVYFFAGSVTAVLPVIILIAIFLQSKNVLKRKLRLSIITTWVN